MVASCKPYHLEQKQGWEEMIERTLSQNDLLANSVYSK